MLDQSMAGYVDGSVTGLCTCMSSVLSNSNFPGCVWVYFES